MPQRLDELLQECTVKITVPGQSGWGTGFFVAPGLILTCAHVVKRSPGQVQVGWQNKTLDAVVEQSIPDPYDLALLRVTLVADVNPPCVRLDEEVQPRDPLYLFGYPDEGDRQGEPRTFNCDGITGSNIAAILFNFGQVRPGMSGSPLLNQRTGRVCGMVKFTRDRTIDMGGGAIPSWVILEQFPQLPDLQEKFHQGDRRWQAYASGIDFQPYLQAILDDDDYREWQEVYTPITVEDRRRMPVQDATTVSQRRFSSRLKLRVETVTPDKQGQGNQPDGTPEPKEQVEQWDVLAGLRNYAAEHVVLIGKPGSGKSTSLERLLGEEAEKALHDPSTQIPVLVKLRRCTGTIEELIRDFLMGHQVAVEIAQVEELLGQGRFLLLLDGLNELPQAFETEVANFRDRYRRTTPMIVSTRDLGVGGTLGIEKSLKMLPLTESQMSEFVRGYLGGEGDRLFQQLSGNRLRKFAETPLLLFTLCWVFDKNGRVPSNLGLAFREFTQLHDKKIQEDAPAESKDQWPKLLRHLAFALMHDKEIVEFRLSMPREEAENLLTTFLQQEGKANARENAERWLQDLLDYHLIQPAIQPNFEEHIEFRHQLIQEYYAAEYLLRLLQPSNGEPGLTDEQLKRDYLNLSKWTEPTLMMLLLTSSEELAKHLAELSIEVHINLAIKLINALDPKIAAKVLVGLDRKIDSTTLRYWFLGRIDHENAHAELLDALSQAGNPYRHAAEIGLIGIPRNKSSKEIEELLTHEGIMQVVKIPESSKTQKIGEIIQFQLAADQRMSAREKLYNWRLGGDTLLAYILKSAWSICNQSSIIVIINFLLDGWNYPYSADHFRDFEVFKKRLLQTGLDDFYKQAFKLIREKERSHRSIFSNLIRLLEMELDGSIKFSEAYTILYFAVAYPKNEFWELQKNDGLSELTSQALLERLFETHLDNYRFVRYLLEIIESIHSHYRFYSYEIWQEAVTFGNRESEIQEKALRDVPKQSTNIFLNATEVNLFERVDRYYENPFSVIETQHNHEIDSEVANSIADLKTLLTQLNAQHPAISTEAEALAIIGTEFGEIKQAPTHRFATLRQQILNPERHAQAIKATVGEVAKHYLEETLLAKAAITYLDKLSKETNHGA